jgi:hypothetical protein
MKYHVRDRFPQYPSSPPRVSEDHGTCDSLPEAQQLAWDVAVARGFDPDGMRWAKFTATTWGLMFRAPNCAGHTHIRIEQEG